MKGHLKTAVGTVIYKADKEFLRDFVESVNRQSDREFDLLIINDNADISDLEYLKDRIENNCMILDAGNDSLPYQNRIDLIRMAKRYRYKLLVLIDYDDIMNADRIYEYRRQYDGNYAFFYNNLKVRAGGTVFKTLPETAEWGDILESNFLGLSNTGINLEQLEMTFIDSLSVGNTSVFDWYMYERILLENKKGKRVDHTWTEYRIYENNIAGINQDIEKEILVKREHYALLEDFHEIYRCLCKRYSQLNNKDIVKKACNNGYWWENIKLLERKVLK